MQEEVEEKSVHLAARGVELASNALVQALQKYSDDLKQKLMDKTVENTTGKQSVKELISQGQGVSSVDIEKAGLKDFQRLANKYGVDFAIVKDKTAEKPRYTVFFKAKDADAINNVIKEYTAKQLKKDAKLERPSVLEKLAKFKDIVANMPHKKEKVKGMER